MLDEVAALGVAVVLKGQEGGQMHEGESVSGKENQIRMI